MEELFFELKQKVYEKLDINLDVSDEALYKVIDVCIYEISQHRAISVHNRELLRQITEVCGYKNNEFELVPLYKYVEEGEDKNGKIIGTLKRQNNSLKNTEKLEWSKDTGTMQCKS